MEDDCEVVVMGLLNALKVAAKSGAMEFCVRFLDVGEAMKNSLRCRKVGEFISDALAGATTKVGLALLETIKT